MSNSGPKKSGLSKDSMGARSFQRISLTGRQLERQSTGNDKGLDRNISLNRALSRGQSSNLARNRSVSVSSGGHVLTKPPSIFQRQAAKLMDAFSASAPNTGYSMDDDDEEGVLIPGLSTRLLKVTPKVWDHFSQNNSPDAAARILDMYGVPDVDPGPVSFGRRSVYVDNMGRKENIRSILGLPVIPPDAPVAVFWSAVMLLVDLVYTAFLMPVSAAFCPMEDHTLNWCSSIDVAAGALFFMNLFLGFHFGYHLAEGYKKLTVMKGSQIAYLYWRRGGLWIDALAVVPFFFQVYLLCANTRDADLNRVLSFLQIFRMFRIFRLLKVMYVNAFSGSFQGRLADRIPVMGLYSMVMGYTVAVLVHLCACVAFLIAYMEGLENSWMNTSAVETLIGAPASESALGVKLYLAALYWSMTTITGTGYGDITPKTPADAVFAMALQLIGVTFFALLVSSMSSLVSKATSEARQANELRTKMSQVNEWMEKRNIPRALRRQILYYYGEVWPHYHDHPLEQEIFRELPNSIRSRVAKHITFTLLTSTPLFAKMDPWVLTDIASKLMPIEIPPGHDLCREGDDDDHLWLLQDGTMMWLRGDQQQLLHAPCLLGDTVLLRDEFEIFRVRPMTYRGVTACRLWQLSLKDMRPLFAANPLLEGEMKSIVRPALLVTYQLNTRTSDMFAINEQDEG